MTARNDIVDSVFGRLNDTSSGLFWRGTYASKKFGRMILSVQSNGGVSDTQRSAFSLFKTNESEIFKDSQEYLFQAYKRHLIAIENDPFQSPEDLAHLTECEEIWGQLEKPFEGGTALAVLFSREVSVFLRLAWNCTWDHENGTSVCIENGKVVSRERWLELQ